MVAQDGHICMYYIIHTFILIVNFNKLQIVLT